MFVQTKYIKLYHCLASCGTGYFSRMFGTRRVEHLWVLLKFGVNL